MNVIFCGYRNWAMNIINTVSKHPKIDSYKIIHSKEEYDNEKHSFKEDIDFILFIGWSWIIPREVTEKYLCVGIHPSDLPLFRGGSPLQHQIIQGIKESKVTLMTLSSDKLDGGHIWCKEDLSLEGDSMAKVFENLENSSIKLLNNFIDNYDEIEPVLPKLEEGTYFKRRKPEESVLSFEQMKSMELEELYNFIRSLTDPYPNACLVDAKGNKLFFKEVSFEKAKKDNQN